VSKKSPKSCHGKIISVSGKSQWWKEFVEQVSFSLNKTESVVTERVMEDTG